MRKISDNKFQLGIFAFNVDGGITKTFSPRRWDPTWDNIRELAVSSDRAGFDFMLPVASWIGHSGTAPTENKMLESLTLTAALLAVTKQITVIATVHTPFLHPVFAAKQIVTCDSIGSGRVALNIVSGAVAEEFSLFGQDMPTHDNRYDLSREWIEIIDKLWCQDQPFHFNGEYFKICNGLSFPKPNGGTRPLVISAGSSPVGRKFAVEHADCLFMIIVDLENLESEIRDIRALKIKEYGPKIYASGHVICRQTTAETDQYYHHLVHECGDWEAADRVMMIHAANGAIPPEKFAQLRERFVTGVGTFLVKGDPDQVAETFAAMSRAGLDGMAFALPNYLDDLPIIRDEVLPRLERLGLRNKSDSEVGASKSLSPFGR